MPPSPSGFLITTLAGRYLALEAEFIQGVLTNEDVGSIQDPVVQGLTYREVDLIARLHLSSERRWDGTDVVLLTAGTCRGCVRVQKVHGILEIQRSQILPLPAQFYGPERRWYRGMILFDGSVALVLNTIWVLEESMDEAAPRTASQGTESSVAWEGAIQGKNQTC